MSTTTVDGVLIVREGTGRLRWAHELEGSPAPLHGLQWQVAGLWPDEGARRHVRARIHRGEPVLIVLDAESPAVELPEEHVSSLPDGIVVGQDDEAGMLTVQVPLLDWLDEEDRRRGLAFAARTRAAIEGTPRFQRPPLVLESDPGMPVVFAYRTGAGNLSSALLRDAVRDLAHRVEPDGGLTGGDDAPPTPISPGPRRGGRNLVSADRDCAARMTSGGPHRGRALD